VLEVVASLGVGFDVKVNNKLFRLEETLGGYSEPVGLRCTCGAGLVGM